MPLQNRVRPEGDIVATPARGTMMGNRGGRIHTADQRLTRRRWASRAWIACLLEYKDWHREVMQPGSYTELFFLDEATALAAGHRPCYLCRNADARRFAIAWRNGNGLDGTPKAGTIDRVLHAERSSGTKTSPAVRSPVCDLPDGAMVRLDGAPWLVHGGSLHAWSFEGYGEVRAASGEPADLITPPSTMRALAAGYAPLVHVSLRRE